MALKKKIQIPLNIQEQNFIKTNLNQIKTQFITQSPLIVAPSNHVNGYLIISFEKDLPVNFTVEMRKFLRYFQETEGSEAYGKGKMPSVDRGIGLEMRARKQRTTIY